MNKPILEGLAEALAYNLTNTRTEIKTKTQIKRKERALMCVCVSSFFAKHSRVLKRSETLTAMLQPCSCTIAGKSLLLKVLQATIFDLCPAFVQVLLYPYLHSFTSVCQALRSPFSPFALPSSAKRSFMRQSLSSGNSKHSAVQNIRGLPARSRRQPR